MKKYLLALLAAALLVAGARPAPALHFDFIPPPQVLGVVCRSQGPEPGDTVTWQFDPIAIYETGKWRVVEETDRLTGLEVELFTGSRPAGKGVIGARQLQEGEYNFNSPRYGFEPRTADGTVRYSNHPYGWPGPPAIAVTAPANRTPRSDRTLLAGRELIGATLARINAELSTDTGNHDNWLVTAGQVIVDEIDGDRKTDLLLEVTAVGREDRDISDTPGAGTRRVFLEVERINRIVLVSDLFGAARLETIAEGRRTDDPYYDDLPFLVGAVEADSGRGLEVLVQWQGWEWEYYKLYSRTGTMGWQEMCEGGGGGL